MLKSKNNDIFLELGCKKNYLKFKSLLKVSIDQCVESCLFSTLDEKCKKLTYYYKLFFDFFIKFLTFDDRKKKFNYSQYCVTTKLKINKIIVYTNLTVS
jgi:hypothetical protein